MSERAPDSRAGRRDRGRRPRRAGRGRRRDRQDRRDGRPLLPPGLRGGGRARRDPRLHLHRQGGGRAAPADPRRASARGPTPARSGRGELLGGLGGAWVTTIHGFCNRLLAAHPVAAGIDPRFRVLDAPEADRAAARGLRRGARGVSRRRRARSASETVAAYEVAGLRGIGDRAPTPSCAAAALAEPELPEPPAPDPAAAIRARRRGRGGGAGGASPRRSARELLERALEVSRAPASRSRPGRAAALRTGSKADRRWPPTARRSRRRSPPSPRPARAATPTATSPSCSSSSRERFEAAKERRAGLDFEDLQLLAARLLERDRARRRLPRPLQPPAGRRVPGHQPSAAAADRGAARAGDRGDGGRRRAAVDLRLPPRRPRRLPRAARAVEERRRARRRSS